MEKQQLNDYLQSKQLRAEAFKELSGSYPLTEEMMLAFQNELDWTKVSDNRSISWCAAKVERWKNRIDWKAFSSNVDTKFLTPNNIERFKDYWDWGALSGRYDLIYTCELIDKYLDRWNWAKLINNYYNNVQRYFYHSHYSRLGRRTDYDPKHISYQLPPRAFLERYQQYIPVENFENSALWNALVEDEKTRIEQELVEIEWPQIGVLTVGNGG